MNSGTRREATPETDTTASPSDRYVLTGRLFRHRAARVQLLEEKPPPKLDPVHRPAKVAQMLALAHHVQDAIDRRLVADRAAVARKLGLTGARITQLLDLLMLAPDLQADVLDLEAVDGAEPVTERTLRAVAHAGTWAEQRAVFLSTCWSAPKEHEGSRRAVTAV